MFVSFCLVREPYRCAWCWQTSTYEHFSTLYSGSKEQKLEETLEILTDKGFSGCVEK